ncbi:2,3-bisphosphoglycerate-independent phosphoglycerate mutase [soil metagenome]
MALFDLPDDLVDRRQSTRIVLCVLDGLGGLPHPGHGATELEAARTPNLDALAASGSLGMHDPVAPGVTPGSGPAHLALFGYDPLAWPVGRGALSALGVGHELEEGDVAIRLNLATLDAERKITDRRAGRPADAEARAVVERLAAGIDLGPDVAFHLAHEKEHRVVLILRGTGKVPLGAQIDDTDPQREGVLPLEPHARDAASVPTAGFLAEFARQAEALLVDEPVIRGILARGIAAFQRFPSMEERFGLRGAAYARYPMYRGAGRLVGMEVPGVPSTDLDAVTLLEEHFQAFDFHFIHAKAPDARGEDGDFDGKVAAIEEVDAWLPRVTALEPDVLLVTGDHSTPAGYGAHTWHPVPVLLRSRWSRPTAATFSENSCRGGDLGHVRGMDLLTLALAHAGRLEKYGA